MSNLEAKPLFEYTFRVDETHLDTFGHMNHATYLQMFEQARWEFITERGYGLKDIVKRQIGPTILQANVVFKRELLLREHITIQTTSVEWSGKIGKVRQQMVNSENKVCSELELTLGMFDMQKRKLMDPPEDWLYAIGAVNG